VQQQLVAVTGAGHRQHHRPSAVDDGDVRDQGLVEDGVQRRDVTDGLLGQPADAGVRRSTR